MVHFPINVKEGEGIDLKEQYKIGSLYPVFILADSEGEVISRWTGYTGSTPFISSLRRGLADLTTIDERTARFDKSPSFQDAIFLAGYSAEAGEYLQAVEYYRRAEKLAERGRFDYSYQIFENMANAAWKEIIPFEQVLPAADTVLASKRDRANNVANAVKILSRLARKFGRTDRLARYLRAAIDVTADSRLKNDGENHVVFLADYTLYVNGDTAEAVRMKKSSLGADWLSHPEKYYDYAKWCLERKIMLDEAEHYAREAGKRTYAGDFRAKVFNTLAEICYEKGNYSEAIRIIEMAIEQDPDNEFYVNQWKKFRGEPEN